MRMAFPAIWYPGRARGAASANPAAAPIPRSTLGPRIGPEPRSGGTRWARSAVANTTPTSEHDERIRLSGIDRQLPQRRRRNATCLTRRPPLSTKSTATKSHPVQDSTERMGQPSQKMNAPLSSNTVPANALASRPTSRPGKRVGAGAGDHQGDDTWVVKANRSGTR